MWSNEQAVLDLITRWFGEYEYREAMEQAQLDYGDVVPSLGLRDLVKMLRSGKQISPRNKAHFANLLEDLLVQPKRRRGRPPKPIEERRSVSIMPDAEGLCLAVIDFLRLNYPKVRVGDVRDRAILWTVKKIGTYEVVGSTPLTEDKLRNYMGRARCDRRRL
jgi:hypothetical protein